MSISNLDPSAIVPAASEANGFGGGRSVALSTPKGVRCGTAYFMGTKSASELRVAGKALGLKSAALKEWVNKALTDETANRQAVAAASLSALHSAGFIADVAKVRKGTASMHFVKPIAPVAKAAPVVDDSALKAAEAKAVSLEAKLAEMAAQLAALTAAKSPKGGKK